MSKLVFLIAVIAALLYIVTAQTYLTDEETRLHAQESNDFFKLRKLKHLIQSNTDELQATPNGAAVVDFSQGFSTSTLQCLHNNGFIAAIPRAYQSVNRVDPNMVSNVANARAAGFQYVDAYAFPCPSCGNAAGQFNTLWNAFAANKVNIGMLWFDIEGSQYWTGSHAQNQSFAKEYVAAAQRVGCKLGIYSSIYQWSSIFGSTSFSLGNYPMWYAHYDSNPRCSDWQSFGGVSTPALKQYIGDTTQCGAGIDISSYC